MCMYVYTISSFLFYSCPVNLADFKQHMTYMRADSDFKYAEQFEVSYDLYGAFLCPIDAVLFTINLLQVSLL